VVERFVDIEEVASSILASRTMNKQNEKNSVTFEVEDQKIVGSLIVTNKNAPTILMIAGGGNIAHTEDYYPSFQQYLFECGINSFAFDFRGVGHSGGTLEETSLDSRLLDTVEALSFLKKNTPDSRIFPLGVSMGAPIALRTAEIEKSRGVILVSPAAYSADAWGKEFGPAFSAVIRKEKSWKNSPDFDIANRISSSVLLVYGKNDEVIPADILKKYEEVSSQKGTVLSLDSVGHSFFRKNDRRNVEAKNKFFTSVVNFVLEKKQ
jgi:uncharacterized protein